MRALLAALAVGVATLVATPGPARGHSFPASRTVVTQVGADEVTLLVAYRPASGAESEGLAGAAQARGTEALAALRDAMVLHAMAPLHVRMDGVVIAPAAIEAKLTVDPPGSTRVAVVVLVTYRMPRRVVELDVGVDAGQARFSWVDRSACAREITSAWEPRRWVDGVAHVLLTVRVPPAGTPPCEPQHPSRSPRSSSAPPSSAAPTRPSSTTSRTGTPTRPRSR